MSKCQDVIIQALERAATTDDTKIQSMDVVLRKSSRGESSINKKAYFLSNKAVRFRHEGKKDGMPPRLLLSDLTLFENKVLVYYSSSGSGKTAELVGSSVTRDAHLTFVVTVEDPERQYINKMAVDRVILPSLIQLVYNARDQLTSVVQAALDSNQPLKLVLAIDEASSCPRVIRVILQYPEHIKGLVLESLERGLGEQFPQLQLKVAVSVAGTGVTITPSTIGSLPENYNTLSPYHNANWKDVIDFNLKKEDLIIKLAVPLSIRREKMNSLDIISKHCPVVAELMHNGRMASIALAELRVYSNTEEEVKENRLVHKIVQGFMASNGMSDLVKNPKQQRAVAASALAVHLFRHLDQFKIEVPRDAEEIPEFACKMNYFKFSTNGCSVKEVVTSYGLLEPACQIENAQRGESIEPPLMMSTPQQLIAVYMLGLGLDSMLEQSWFGFEFMSTHLVKCAIAASAAIHRDSRPTLKDTLACLGFVVDAFATADEVKETWTEMEDWVATNTLPLGIEPTVYHSTTRQLDVGLKIVENGDEEILQIDRTLHSTLMNINCSSDRDKFGLPITCINEGNSNLCDGIVTFYAILKEGAKKKISIMIQAKDYHTANLSATALNKHAETIKKKVLDGVFGETRLLCVASSHPSLMATKPVENKRNYLPFVFNRGTLLSNLLAKLQSQRSHSNRISKYACFCDEDGDEIDFSPRKTKKARTG